MNATGKSGRWGAFQMETLILILKTVLTCYKGSASNCATPSSVPILPIMETDVRTTRRASVIRTRLVRTFTRPVTSTRRTHLVMLRKRRLHTMQMASRRQFPAGQARRRTPG